MHTARLSNSGRGQVVHLPAEFAFDGSAVEVRRVGNGVLLLPLTDPWLLMEQALEEFERGLALNREQQSQQERAALRPDSPAGT